MTLEVGATGHGAEITHIDVMIHSAKVPDRQHDVTLMWQELGATDLGADLPESVSALPGPLEPALRSRRTLREKDALNEESRPLAFHPRNPHPHAQ